MGLKAPSYRWSLVATLAISELVSFGVLLFAFSPILVAMEAELGWSRALLTGAYSLAALVAGVAAIPVGAWIDRHGPRALMTGGSGAASALLVAWSFVEHPVAYYGIWCGLGVCMAAVLYEAAFTVVAKWFDRERARAIGWITIVAGLASTLFVPFTTLLLAEGDWRFAVRVLAGVILVATALPHALMLRANPVRNTRAEPANPVRVPTATVGSHAGALRFAAAAFGSRRFRWTSLAFALSTFAAFGLYVHLIPLLVERHVPLTVAGLAMGTLGLTKLFGRALFTGLAGRVALGPLTFWVLAVQAAGLLVLLAVPGAAGMWAGVVLFGMGDGATTPARASLIAELFGEASYGAFMGVLALVLSLAKAGGPIGLSLLRAGAGSYTAVLLFLLCGMGVSMGALALAGDAARSGGFRRPASRPR